MDSYGNGLTYNHGIYGGGGGVLGYHRMIMGNGMINGNNIEYEWKNHGKIIGISIYLSVCLSICLSIYLSICLCKYEYI